MSQSMMKRWRAGPGSFPALALLVALAGPALAADPAAAPSGPALSADPVLAGYVSDALGSLPELARAQANNQADLERIPQSRAMPDPVLSLGIQNDGFRRIRIGEMESSYLSIMASQTFPWHGKRGLRGEVAGLEARLSETAVDRARLAIAADVGRAYLDLLLARDQLSLLGRVESLWTQAEAMARVRYETGDGAQSDLIRAQLERSRLKQRRWALEAEDRRRAAVLNRLRGHALDEALPVSRSLLDLPDPELPADAAAWQEAEAQSPELRRAELAAERSSRLVDLAGRDAYPDLTVSAAVMPRGDAFEPMWQAGVSFPVPVWSGSKQSRAVAENRLRQDASRQDVASVRQLLRQRVTERNLQLGALLEANRLYRTELLVQSEATVSSAMAQYQVGRTAFASVLDALGGYVADLGGYLESTAAAQRLDIARREVSLDPAAGMSAGGAGGTSVPGAGATGAGSSASAESETPPPAGAAGSSSMSKM